MHVSEEFRQALLLELFRQQNEICAPLLGDGKHFAVCPACGISDSEDVSFAIFLEIVAQARRAKLYLRSVLHSELEIVSDECFLFLKLFGDGAVESESVTL